MIRVASGALRGIFALESGGGWPAAGGRLACDFIVSACCSQWVRASSSLKSVGVAWVVASVVKLFGGLWAFVGLVMKVVGTVLAVLRLRCLGPWGGGRGGSCSVVKLFGG